MQVEIKCKTCGTGVEIECDPNDWVAWYEGKLIQDAMPYLTVDQREVLISGMCGVCFDNLFSEGE